MFGQDKSQNSNSNDAAASFDSTSVTAPSLPPLDGGAVFTAPVAEPEIAAPAIAPTAVAAPATSNDDLLSIKQEALQQLTPLVGHLDQSPEEKFRTTMMMIQAADDQTLVRTAYDAAKQITDEKARAQALLDIVNEINYFTQHTAK